MILRVEGMFSHGSDVIMVLSSLNFHSREIIDMTEELFAELYFIEHRNIPSL